MNIKAIDSLTPTERRVLRLVLTEREHKVVALKLGLSPETVKSHLRNAREKCGASTSFSLARALADHESAPPPAWGIPSQGGDAFLPGAANFGEPEDVGGKALEGVAEQRMPFEFDAADAPRASITVEKTGRGPTPLMRLLLAGLVALIMILSVILAFPLAESFQRLANVIDPPT